MVAHLVRLWLLCSSRFTVMGSNPGRVRVSKVDYFHLELTFVPSCWKKHPKVLFGPRGALPQYTQLSLDKQPSTTLVSPRLCYNWCWHTWANTKNSRDLTLPQTRSDGSITRGLVCVRMHLRSCTDLKDPDAHWGREFVSAGPNRYPACAQWTGWKNSIALKPLST